MVKMNIDRVLAPRLVSRAFAAGFLLTPFLRGQVPVAAPSPNQIGAGRLEWGAETREEHAARMIRSPARLSKSALRSSISG